jgi:hypothetical protein
MTCKLCGTEHSHLDCSENDWPMMWDNARQEAFKLKLAAIGVDVRYAAQFAREIQKLDDLSGYRVDEDTLMKYVGHCRDQARKIALAEFERDEALNWCRQLPLKPQHTDGFVNTVLRLIGILFFGPFLLVATGPQRIGYWLKIKLIKRGLHSTFASYIKATAAGRC